MFNQPEGAEQDNILHNPPNKGSIYNVIHSLYSDAADRSWEVFHYFVHVHMWDGFVYLFLLVWDSEPNDSHLDNEFTLIEGHLSNLHNSEASSKDKSVATDEIIKQFKEYRNTKNEDLRNEVMSKVYYHLFNQSIYGERLTNLIALLKSMSYLQKQALRHIFISRIYGYSKFAEYLSREWKNKPIGEARENEQLLTKENQTHIIETGLKQILNLGNQNDVAAKFRQEILDRLESSQNEKTYADALKVEKNTNKLEETINNSFNKNSEIVKPVSDSTEFSKTEKPAYKKIEILDNIEIKKKKESPEFVNYENLTKKKEVENETINKDDKENNIETNKDDKGDDNIDKIETNKDNKDNIENNKVDKDGNNIETNKYNKEDNIEVNASENPSKEKIRIDQKNSRHRDSSYKRSSINVERLQQEIEVLRQEVAKHQAASINVEKLQQEIETLRQEAAKHQAALGGIINVGWRDDDSNNSMQLTKDIEKLQKDLADFTRVKRGGIKINNDAVRTLLQNLKCKTLVEHKTNVKLVLSAALQQKLIKITLNTADDYFKRVLNGHPDKVDLIADEKLEAAIFSKTNQLIELTERFTKVNTGTDAHTLLLPIKIRQHIYAALGQRSFTENHPFIKNLLETNLNGMNKYRTIDDEEKNKKITSEAAIIIRQILHLFYFRLQTQEPKPSIKFYESGDEFDHSVMESVGQIKNDDDDGNEDLEVEICSFPAIALLDNLDEEERRVFTKAQVIVRQKKSVKSKTT
ncbi:hypothetical protein GLOIN_2v1646194 [Rhizophagus clarus]|uniref:Uncharacterized protein n=1 Tax=Rhizophagus clarus TaxID=94130 RepID=A0A8H3M3J8_9GLOM|nr:hypothetical protein GLOIN_2v1646194 [Rhizophagus clarus]